MSRKKEDDRAGTERPELPERLKELSDKDNRLGEVQAEDTMFRFRIRAPYSTAEPIKSTVWRSSGLK